MKTNLLLLIALLALLFEEAKSQEAPHKFGSVSKEELLMDNYEKDPEASAVVLSDIGKSVFADNDRGFDIRFTRTKRIKIFNKGGLDYAEFAIPYYQDGFGKIELVTDIEAFTYNLEFGKVVKHPLDEKNIYVEKKSEKWFLKKFAMPQVREGSVIEIRYVLKTPFKYNLPDWEFQHRIPTLYSEYEARMIPFYEYTYIFQGADKFDHFESYEQPGVSRQFGTHQFNEMTYKFVMKDVPAFKDESYISSINDYLIKLDFQLAKYTTYQGVPVEIITTWPKLNNELLKHSDFGKYINTSESASKKILEHELNLTGKSSQEKCEAIVKYVKDSFRWNGYSAKYAQKKVKDLLKEKVGTSAEINLFLVGMLKAAGLESHAVLVSTRSHGKIPVNYPFEHFFNDLVAVVNVDGQFILTDGTDDLLRYNRIPRRCINDQGLLVVKDSEYWVSLNQNIASIQQEKLKLDILPNSDSLVGKISRQMTEYIARDFRNAYQDKEHEVKKALLEEGFREVKLISTANYSTLESPYGITFEAKMPVERFEDKISVAPFLQLPISDNILKQDERIYPVDMVIQNRRIFKSELTIPSSYAVLKLPENFLFEDDLIQMNYSVRKVDEKIFVEGSYFFKKSVYQPEEYTSLKKHFDKLVQIFNAKIILSNAS